MRTRWSRGSSAASGVSASAAGALAYTQVQARAIENQCYFIATNQCGIESHGTSVGEVHYFGHSMVVDPWGEILLEAGEAEGVYLTDIDISLVAKVREHLTALNDRKPELY